MPVNLAQIVKEATNAPVGDFTELVKKATDLLQNERGRIGNLQVLGRLLRVKPAGQALVMGDLHGDLESLVEILHQSNILQRMDESSSVCLVFLGDYGDRGPFSAEVYSVVLNLKLRFSSQVVLMRGNHEGPKDLLASPHDLPAQLETRFRNGWAEAYKSLFELFSHLYTSVLLEKRCLMIHGGLPEQNPAIEDLAYAHERHPGQSFLEEMLWSDPIESFEGTYPSPRGAGKLFGKDVTNRVLKNLGVEILIRGHESCDEGFKINHEGKVLTLFSRKGFPYHNTHGAYLDLSLCASFKKAEQLVPCIHKF